MRAAVSHSYNEYIKKDDGITIDPNIDKARVSMQHFKVIINKRNSYFFI